MKSVKFIFILLGLIVVGALIAKLAFVFLEWPYEPFLGIIIAMLAYLLYLVYYMVDE